MTSSSVECSRAEEVSTCESAPPSASSATPTTTPSWFGAGTSSSSPSPLATPRSSTLTAPGLRVLAAKLEDHREAVRMGTSGRSSLAATPLEGRGPLRRDRQTGGSRGLLPARTGNGARPAAAGELKRTGETPPRRELLLRRGEQLLLPPRQDEPPHRREHSLRHRPSPALCSNALRTPECRGRSRATAGTWARAGRGSGRGYSCSFE